MPLRRRRQAAEDVAAADDDADLDAERVDLGDLAGDERAERRVDAVLAVAEERLAGQLEQDPAVADAAVPAIAPVAERRRSQLLPERVAGEPADPDVLADRRDRLGDQVADGALLVAERLLEQADLRVPLLELALDDLRADRLGLLLDATRRRASSAFFASRTSAGIASTST